MSTHDVSHFSTILVIDTTKTDATNVAVIHGGEVVEVRRQERAQKLQEMIVEALEKAKLTLKSINAVAVLRGPGSYTGTRMGVTTANIINWLQNTLIIEVNGTDFDKAIRELTSGGKFTVAKTSDALY